MRHLFRLTFILFGFAAAVSAHAETWPSRLIKATIPFGAGSATDVVPRVVFDRLAAELGQSIVVENRPGAGGTLGTALVAKRRSRRLQHAGAFLGADDCAGDLSQSDFRREKRSCRRADDRLQRQCDDRAAVAAVENRAGVHR